MNNYQAELVQMKTLLDEAIDLVKEQEVIFHGYETKNKWYTKAYDVNKRLGKMLYVAKLQIEVRLK